MEENVNLNDELENTEEIDVENQVFTYDDVQDIIQQVLPKVEINMNKVEGTNVDKQSFSEGVKHASFWSGFYSCLKSVGCSEDTILQMMLNKDTGNINIEQQKVINEGQLEVAKIQKVQTESYQI